MARFTRFFITAVLVIGMAFDVYLAFNAERGDTISEITLARSVEWLMWPLCFGVVAGHLFWPMRKVAHKWPRIYAGTALAVGALAVDVLVPSFKVFPLWPFIVGVVMGHFLWPQVVKS